MEIESRLATLPQNDFYNRVVASSVSSQEHLELINDARRKLSLIIQSFLGVLPPFDASSQQDVGLIIKQLDYQLKQLGKTSPLYQEVEKKLALMNELNKINNLSLLSIPVEGETEPKLYCQLAESTGGVTEKLSLVSLESVKMQMTNLTDSKFQTPEDYFSRRDDFKLQTEAILKLPKHGDIREVQRESMALNASRILGLKTTESSMVSWNGKPALFVPFAKIELLQDFAKGETFRAAGFSGQTYQHYATINALGNGLEANTHIEDFGKSLALFALCHDTDAVGGYIQNKALQDGKNLFIFDQVIMARDKMILDSRLSLQPSEFIMKHTRHGQGRNRTLIEDSSIEEKFASLMMLKAKATTLEQYAQRTIEQHAGEIQKLKKSIKPDDQDKLKDLIALRDDAIVIKDTMNRRIIQIDQALPRHGSGINNEDLKKTLILEKLLHNPVLFTDSGRPYRNPWTQRHDNPAKSVSINPQNGLVMIQFDNNIDRNMVEFIKRNACQSLQKVNNNTLTLSRTDLKALSETQLFPEQQAALDPGANYLNSRDLQIIQTAYKEGNSNAILNLVQSYETIIKSQNEPITNQIERLIQMENKLTHLIKTTQNPGFGLHVLKKLHCETQQTLQAHFLHDPEMKKTINTAFQAARKLDRMAEFNHVLITAVREGKTEKKEFTQFLTRCVEQADGAPNHHEAKMSSEAMRQLARSTIDALSPASAATHSPEQNWTPINPIVERFNELKTSLSRMLTSVFKTDASQPETRNNNRPRPH